MYDCVRSDRRRLLAAAGLWGLSGCSLPVSFNSIDVTGAPYGRDFRLWDSEGRPRSLADYRGRVLLLFFGFTQCPDICPTALGRAAAVMQRLGPAAARLQVIFVTIDPERDAPDVLREYARAFHPTFIGLHGDAAATAAAAAEFRIYYKKIPTGASYTMDHSAVSYAIDAGGRLRLAVRHEQDAASVAADLKHLLDGA